MEGEPLDERCLRLAEDVAHQEGWQLGDAGQRAMVEAVRPFVEAEILRGADDDRLRIIIRNYYRDGPMWQAMRASHSPEGERLWTEWRAYFVRVAICKWGLSPHDADDLAQETYLQAARALNTFRFAAQLKTYLIGVLANCHRRWRRDTTRADSHFAPVPDGDSDEEAAEPRPPSGTPSLEEVVLGRESDTQVRAAFEQEIAAVVRGTSYAILRLYYLEQTYLDAQGHEARWTDEAIGKYLNLPLNTVTSQRLRALKRIRNAPAVARRLGGLLDREKSGDQVQDSGASGRLTGRVEER